MLANIPKSYILLFREETPLCPEVTSRMISNYKEWHVKKSLVICLLASLVAGPLAAQELPTDVKQYTEWVDNIDVMAVYPHEITNTQRMFLLREKGEISFERLWAYMTGEPIYVFPVIKAMYGTEAQREKFKETNSYRVMKESLANFKTRFTANGMRFSLPREWVSAWDSKSKSFSILTGQNFVGDPTFPIAPNSIVSPSPLLWYYFEAPNSKALKTKTALRAAKEVVQHYLEVPCPDKQVALTIEQGLAEGTVLPFVKIMVTGEFLNEKVSYFTGAGGGAVYKDSTSKTLSKVPLEVFPLELGSFEIGFVDIRTGTALISTQP